MFAQLPRSGLRASVKVCDHLLHPLRRALRRTKPGQRTGKFRLGSDQLLVDASGQSKISVQDYAVAMIDELERRLMFGSAFGAGYRKQAATNNEVWLADQKYSHNANLF